MLALIVSAAMSGLLHSCAPNVGSKTMAGIVQYESGWKQFAIGDNDTHRAYYPDSQPEATAVVTSLLRLGHNLDAGLGQVNSANWDSYGLSSTTVFDPCSNLRVASRILSENYATSVRNNWLGHTIASDRDAYLQQQYALIHALSAYNSGKFWASMDYAGNVYSLARSVTSEEPTAFPGAIPPPGTPLMTFDPIPRPASGTHAIRLASTSSTTSYGPRVRFRPSWASSQPIHLPHRHLAAPHI